MARKALHILLIDTILICTYWCKRGICASSEECCATGTCCDPNPTNEDCCREHHDCCSKKQSDEHSSSRDSSYNEQPEDKNVPPSPSEPNDPSRCGCQCICDGAILEEDDSVTSSVDDTFHTVVSGLTQNQLFQQTSYAPLPSDGKWPPGSSLRILYQSFLL